MKILRVTVEDEQGNKVFNDLVHVAEVSDLQMLVDNLEILAKATKDILQRLVVLENKDRRLR